MNKRYWLIIITYIVMQLSVPIVVELFSIEKVETIIYLSILSFVIALIFVLFFVKPDMQAKLKDGFNIKEIILWSILGIFMAYFAQSIAVAIELNLFKIVPGSENTQQIMGIARTIPFFVIIPAIIAPILEEVIFRKIIFGSLYTRTNFFIAAIISAFIFGIIHGEPEHILIYTSMGLVFAYLYIKTKSILTPIIVHIGLNSISVIAQFNLSPDDFKRMQEQFDNLQSILIGG